MASVASFPAFSVMSRGPERSGGWRAAAARRARGFTLIELLIVVAIITILAALVMPSIVSSMKSANAASCKSNLHQIAGAFLMYVKEHHEFMPPSGSPGGTPPRCFPRWYNSLNRYARDIELFRCPGKKVADFGYGLNHMWCGPSQIYGGGTAMWNTPKEVGLVQAPSATLFICDTGVVSNKDDPPADWIEKGAANTNGCCRFPYDNEPGNPGEYTYYDTDPRRPVPRHQFARTNVLFFDGHIEGIETADIVDDLWDEPGCIYDNDGHPKRKEEPPPPEE